VIIGMHHEQDMRKMGGLAKYMPITAITSWIGTLALVGTPFFSGFYSKDAIIEAVGESHRWGATYAYYCVLLGVFITSLYSFRLVFMTFHGPERFRHAHGHGHASEAEAVADTHAVSQGDAHGAPAAALAAAHGDVDAHGAHSGAAHGHGSHGAPAGAHATAHDAHGTAGAHGSHGAAGHDAAHGHDDAHHGPPRESPWVVTIPLIALAIPSLIIGFITIGPVLFGDFFGNAIHVAEQNDVIREIGEHDWHGAVQFALHGAMSLPFLLMVLGFITAWVFFYWKPSLANSVARTFSWLRTILINKYYFDWINENIIAAASRLLGRSLWRGGDMALIDGGLVNGTAASVGWFGSVMRNVQSGYLYSYAFWMIIGLAVMLGYFLWRAFGF
jgi:NADH-quinone oxidoreductase subunit L